MSRLEQNKHGGEASREERIYNLVEQTMAEFNHVEQLPPYPYLFTRVQAELQDAHAPRRSIRPSNGGVSAAACSQCCNGKNVLDYL